jgi:hypothetical protein
MNDITANAGGLYVFDASNLSVNVNGTSGGGSGLAKTFDWTAPGGPLTNSPGPNIAFGLAESGLVNTADTSSIDLVVTEQGTGFVSASDAASVSYANAPPSVLSATGINEADLSVTFSATFADADLSANALVAGFEVVQIEFLYTAVVFLNGGGNVDLPTLLGIFGGAGVFGVEARATDTAGLSHSFPFSITVVGECLVNEDCAEGEICSDGVCTETIPVPASTPSLRVVLAFALLAIACAAPWLTRRRAQ